MEILEIKMISEIKKKLLNGVDSRMEMAVREKCSNLKGREENNQDKKNSNSLRACGTRSKRSNILVTGAPGGKRKEVGGEKKYLKT